MAAVPSGVLPQSLSTAFAESRVFPVLSVQYHDGRVERGLITDTVNPAVSLRVWHLAKRLTSAQLVTLRTFFEGQNGGLTPFYFYNPLEPAPGHAIGSNYDATGTSTQGRHTVRFRGDWSESTEMARSTTSLEMVSVL